MVEKSRDSAIISPTRAIAGELPIVSAIRAGGCNDWNSDNGGWSVVEEMSDEKKKGQRKSERARGSGGNEMRSSDG